MLWVLRFSIHDRAYKFHGSGSPFLDLFSGSFSNVALKMNFIVGYVW